MAFITANTGEQIKAKFDGALRSTFSNNSDYIVKGIGDEFECTYSSASLEVQIGTGVGLIGGRGIEAEDTNSITLPANTTTYLCLRIDLTQLQGQVGMLYANTSSVIQQGNLNNDNSAIRDMLLYEITTDTNGVVNIEDKRNTLSSMLDVIYPVGSIYLSVNNVNPSNFLGGSWTKVGSKLTISENVFGNGKNLAITDGDNIGSLGARTTSGQYIAGIRNSGLGGTPNKTTNTALDGYQGNFGVPTKAQLGGTPANSGLITDTITCYIWKRTA